MEIPSPNHGRVRFLGSFVCPSLEQDFRRKHLREDVRLAFACSGVVLAASFFYVMNGYLLYGTSAQFLVLLIARAACVLASLGLLLALRRCASSVRLDRAVSVWCLVLAAGNLTIIGTQTSGNLGHALMSLGVPLVTYCVLPLPLTRQLVFAISFSVLGLVVAFASGVDPRILLTLAGAYLIANGIGSFTSWQLNHRRRLVYLAGVRETELRSNLEQALAEVKTLHGMLRICAWCKRIRDEEQAWQPVESYVQGHSHAEFSHGICDQCIREQLGEEGLQRVLSPVGESSS